MKMPSTAQLTSIAKRVIREAQKPENQAKIKKAADRAKSEFDKRRGGRTH